jgi:hypothetical protein
MNENLKHKGLKILIQLDIECKELMKNSKYWIGNKGGSFFCKKSFDKHYGRLMIISGIKRKQMDLFKKNDIFGEKFEKEMIKYKLIRNDLLKN